MVRQFKLPDVFKQKTSSAQRNLPQSTTSTPPVVSSPSGTEQSTPPVAAKTLQVPVPTQPIPTQQAATQPVGTEETATNASTVVNNNTLQTPVPTQPIPAQQAATQPVPQQPVPTASQQVEQQMMPGVQPAQQEKPAQVNHSLILQYARALAQSLARTVPGLGKLFSGSSQQAGGPGETGKLDAFGDRLLGIASKLETALSPGRMIWTGEDNLSKSEGMRREAEERQEYAKELREKSKGESDPHTLAEMLREARENERKSAELFNSAKKKSTIGNLQSGFGQVGQGIANAGSGKEMSAAGDVMGGSSKMAMAIPGVGKPIAAMLKFGEVTLKSMDRLQEWSNSIHESNMRFAEFSSAMAGVQARQIQRDIQLSKERGDRRAGTAEDMAQAKSRLDNQLAIIQDKIGDISNILGTKILGAISDILDYLPSLKSEKDHRDKVPGLGQEMGELGDKEYERRYGRPPRFSNRTGAFDQGI